MTGRWVLTIKTDRQGNFLKATARWVLRGFQDKQKEYQRTDSPASTRLGFRMSCKMAASKSWNIFHIDLKTTFLQEQSDGVNRDVVCQLLPEAGHHPSIAAGLKKPVYGMNEAPRRWWNILDKALCIYGMVPTRADRYCHVLYSDPTCKQNWNKTCPFQGHGKNDISHESRARSKGDPAFEKMLDPIEGTLATGKSVAGIINLFADDLIGTGGTEMEQRVLTRLRKNLQVGSEDWNDVLITGQR